MSKTQMGMGSRYLRGPPGAMERWRIKIRLTGMPPALQCCRKPRALINRTFRVQLGGHVGTADDVMGDALVGQRIRQRTIRHLTRAEDNIIRLNQRGVLARFAKGHVQAVCVDPLIVHTAHKLHVLHLESGAVDPARGLAQAPPMFFRLALQQCDGAGGSLRLRPLWRQAAAMLCGVRDTPFHHPFGQVFGRAFALVHQVIRHVEPDATGAHNGDPLAGVGPLFQHVDIGVHVSPVLPRDLRVAGQDAGGDDHLVKALQHVHRCFSIQPHVDPHIHDHRPIPVDEAPEFFLAGHLFGHVELAADLVRAVDDGDAVPPLSGGHGGRKTRRPRAHDGDGFLGRRRFHHQLGLRAGTWVHQTGTQLARERVIKARLIAGDAGRDMVRFAVHCLAHKMRVGQHGARHGHHVGAAGAQHFFGNLRGVDPVGGDDRDGHLTHQLFRNPGKGRAWDRRRDGRDARLVPADAGVDDGGARFLYFLGQ
mmetsp:Transcript_29736/g.59155  ORF Transcript_29736/g.59155 Transcript_29736/m.59155 type:complete len:479 (-) Transcript_29736:782-2218(-)